MSPRFAAALAALACGVGSSVAAPAALAAPPPGRDNGHDCDVFNANDDAIQGGLDSVDALVTPYYTSWVGNSFFGDEQYQDYDTDDINAILDSTSSLAAHADSAKRSVQTRGASLALARVADDARAVHDAALKVQSGEYRARQLGFVKDVLGRSENNYHNAYSMACGGDIVDPQH